MTSAWASKSAHRIEEKLGEKKSLLLIQIGLLLSLFLMALMIPIYGVLFFFLIPLMAGFSGVVLSDYINHNIKSSHRATLLSIKSFFSNIGLFILFPIVGWITREFSMGKSFAFLGIISLLGFLIVDLIFKDEKD